MQDNKAIDFVALNRERARVSFVDTLRQVINAHGGLHDILGDAVIAEVLGEIQIEHMDKLEKDARRRVQVAHIRRMRGIVE